MSRATTIHRTFLLVALAYFTLPAPSAFGHAAPGSLTLHDLCRSADVVAVARISYVPQLPPGSTTLPPVDAEVLELIREGDANKGQIRFLSHRHSTEQYAAGEELILFLEHTKSPEKTKEAPYETIEAIGDRLVLPKEKRQVWIDAVRKYVALGKGARDATEPRSLAVVSMAMLGSDQPELAQMALRDLTLAGNSATLTRDDLPLLLRVVDDASRPAMLRVGLLSELERRKLVAVGAKWVGLLETAAPGERTAVISGAKSRWFVPEVNAALIAIVGQGKPDEVAAAARALGAEGNDDAVEVLSAAAMREPADLRFAAIGSLRRINTAKARDKLASLVASHPDPETRKVATTEMAMLPAVVAEPKHKAPEAPNGFRIVTTRRTLWTTVGGVLLVIVVVVGALWGRGKKPAT